MMPHYAELCVTSNFTFLKGASHPEELVTRAAELGLEAIAITDQNSLAGVVRAYSALQELKRALEAGESPYECLPKLIVGCRIVLSDSDLNWIALPTNRAAYARLSKLLSVGKRRVGKGECNLTRADILEHCTGMIMITTSNQDIDSHEAEIADMARAYPGHIYLGAAPRFDGHDALRMKMISQAAHRLATPMVAIGDVLMHRASRRAVADVLTCMREHIKIDEIGKQALRNAEARLRPPQEMAKIFREYPSALKRSVEVAQRCGFCLSELSYEYPDEIASDEPPQKRLERLVEKGLTYRYPQGVSDKAKVLAKKELAMVDTLGFAAYFLTVYDLVQFARSQGILCQGRGSAANSILCYALQITEVGPEQISMVFERFISEARGEPPDIDVDFEHERREEVIQHIYKKYGRERAGLCATVTHFRSRAAIKEVGKVMGLSEDITAALSGQIWGWSSHPITDEQIREIGLNPKEKRLVKTVKLIQEIIGFPRHLSQHVGGFIITKGRLDELCPIENAAMEDRTVIEWDKDDIDALGILKIDVLSLGMLTCIRKSFDLLSRHHGQSIGLENLPREDPLVYDMLCRADAVGVFQVESRAQLNFLPRMRPREFYDLVIEVAIVRPGPIQGGMVHPYINRRQGKEKIVFPSGELEEVLGKTLGVPLFQEQAMQIAIVGAGFDPGEADRLRRSLATFRRMGTISTFRDRFMEGMLGKGYEESFAAACFSQIEGFGEYGFPESHAASFALLVYASAWLKCHYPAEFSCAILNSQPMGFYAPAQLVRDAREHGVEIRPVCVNSSDWDCTLERRMDGQMALRLGFRQVKGVRQYDAEWIVAARGNGYPDPEAIWLRAGVNVACLEKLAEADAFTDMGLNRRRALWEVKAMRAPKPLPLFGTQDGEGIVEKDVVLRAMNLGEEIVEDYLAMRLSLKAHPMELLRPAISGIVLHSELVSMPLSRVQVCGLVITRQRPGTASGVVFITLEDETGVSNIVVWGKFFERYRRIVMTGRLLKVTGRLEREGIVAHVIAEHIEDYSSYLEKLGHPNSHEIHETTARADSVPKAVSTSAHHPREQAKKLFSSRDFH